MSTLQFHDAANMLPMLDDQALADLAEDIRSNGLREPIWLYEDKILDGRNRYCACLAAEVQPQYRTYLGDQPFGFVISLNLHRRHLTYDQRVGLGLKIRPALAEEATARRIEIGRQTGRGHVKVQPNSAEPLGESATQTAKIVGVGKTAIKEMATAEKEHPTLADDLVSGKTTVREVRAEQNRQKRVERMRPVIEETPTLDTINRCYPVLYADPPWRYEHVISDSRAIENQYPTMSHEEICALPVSDLATEHAVLFMWATSPKLKSAFDVLDAWGFEYKTCAVWCKDKIGMGYYFRQQHELLLVAVRGTPATPRTEDRHSSIITAPRLDHSAKPLEVYELIEHMYPDLPRIELFNRQPREGWATWGNQSYTTFTNA